MTKNNDDLANRWKKLSGRYKGWMDTVKNRDEPLSETELKLVRELENTITSYEEILKNE